MKNNDAHTKSLNRKYDIPEDEGTLGVHKVKFVVEPRPGLAHRRGVGQGAHRSLHLLTHVLY